MEILRSVVGRKNLLYGPHFEQPSFIAWLLQSASNFYQLFKFLPTLQIFSQAKVKFYFAFVIPYTAQRPCLL